jgi:hypothetical protein
VLRWRPLGAATIAARRSPDPRGRDEILWSARDRERDTAYGSTGRGIVWPVGHSSNFRLPVVFFFFLNFSVTCR